MLGVVLYTMLMCTMYILDAEMSMNLFATHLYNRVQFKIFTLRKIRTFINKNAANIIYK